MNQERIGKFIAELRKSRKLTQLQLGDKIGVSDKTVSKWETGLSIPDLVYLNDLCEALDTSIPELLSGEKIKKISSDELNSSLKYYTNQNNKKIMKKMSLIVIGIVIFFLGIIVLLFVNNNYDNCNIYSIFSENENYKIDGLIINTPEKDIFLVNNLKNVSDYDMDKEVAYSFQYSLSVNDINIYENGNIALYEHNKHNSSYSINGILSSIKIFIEEDHDYNDLIKEDIIKHDIELKIKYIDKKQEIKEISFKLNKRNIFTNNKLIYEKGKEF